MEQHVGIDVSLEQSSVCLMNRTGQILRETKVASDPEALLLFLGRLDHPVTLVGMEAGPLSQWLHAGLAAGVEVVLMETRQVKAALSAMIAKRSPEGRRSAPVARFERRDGRRLNQDRPARRARDRTSLANGVVPAGALASPPRPGRCARC